MRKENEILDLILDTAREDERIRAVIMNGSRANPNVPSDPFQDFDIVFLVSDITPFRNNPAWIARFGELLILQMPDAMGTAPPNQDGRFAYLMQFSDGNRIDLTFVSLEYFGEFTRDSLTEILLDKDGILPNLPPASDRDYLPIPPTTAEYADCCNEFWWVCTYVAKGLWRGEILYAKHYQEHQVRAQLMKMLTWYAGIQTQFSRSFGKNGKYLKDQLDSELWKLVLSTYSDTDYDRTWDALLNACDLFRKTALVVGEHFEYTYPQADDLRVSTHLKHVRELNPDSDQIY
jgi:aminoglycoside 6-adenylyltransferase